MRIDAHQHFWSLERGDYGWLTPDLAPIYRDYLPSDLKPFLQSAGIEGTILVQAAPTAAETKFMLSLADQASFIKGVVGWVDLEAPDAPDQITKIARDPKLVGLRPMIQDIADDDWILRDALTPAFQAMIAHGLRFDALTLPRHLPNLRRFLGRFPDLCVIIDHGSKPEIRRGEFDVWATEMDALARDSNVFCKLSGLVTEAAAEWQTSDLVPYVDHLLASFGPARLIWGSDWPVCTLACDYTRWLETTDHLLATLTQSERDMVMGLNAIRAYDLQI